MTRDEVVQVLRDLRKRAKGSVNKWQNLIVFRLACCGLRVKEIVGLNIGDIVTEGSRPCITVRKEITKGRDGKRKSRIVPLSWSRGSLDDLAAWINKRVNDGALLTDPVICSQNKGKFTRLDTSQVAKRWKTAIRCLGPARVSQLSIHCGRHTFASHALLRGHDVANVRDALGHASISTTNIYTHVLEGCDLPDVFGE